ncbi:unnamed protein product [Fraxinus pennsylvanica]|uniref:Nucleic acid binding NABP domain-containing protein n=1 Tax=Fraxinus pennsylvanica TaxID=56036 RepID=A0AAD1ZI26_9LAMI|nr:unnamed protein product [Fraxinus pennsylvanica]
MFRLILATPPTALPGMSLSANSVVDGGKHQTSHIHHEIDAHQNLFHSQSDQTGFKNSPYLNKSESMQYYKLAKSSANSFLKGSSTPTLSSGGSPASSQYHNIDSLNSSLPNHGFGGFAINPWKSAWWW